MKHKAQDLPLYETKRAHQMAARLELDVLVILGADLAELERRTHLTVEFILLLGHSDMIFCHIRDQRRQIRVRVLSVGVQVAAAKRAHSRRQPTIEMIRKKI